MSLATDSPRKPPAVSTPQFNVDFGTIVLTGFSILSLVVSLAKGVVPIYLGEAVLWAISAWFWHKRKPDSQANAVILLLLAVGVAAGEGYFVGVQSSASNRQTPVAAAVPPGFVIDKIPSNGDIWQQAEAKLAQEGHAPQTEQKMPVKPPRPLDGTESDGTHHLQALKRKLCSEQAEKFVQYRRQDYGTSIEKAEYTYHYDAKSSRCYVEYDFYFKREVNGQQYGLGYCFVRDAFVEGSEGETYAEYCFPEENTVYPGGNCNVGRRGTQR